MSSVFAYVELEFLDLELPPVSWKIIYLFFLGQWENVYVTSPIESVYCVCVRAKTLLWALGRISLMKQTLSLIKLRILPVPLL